MRRQVKSKIMVEEGNLAGKEGGTTVAPGTLYLCATPIGNLEDITLRVLKVLAGVDLVVAEDTRVARKLLTHFQISVSLVSCHQHNWRKRVPEIISRLHNGQSVAVVSDAGTPGISDPGAELVRAAIEAGIRVVPLPGASALLTALVASGLATDTFVFEGFLPAKGRARAERLARLKSEPRTIILYEAPHRLLATLRDLLEVLGDRRACAARELTKIHEEFIRGTLSTLLAHFAAVAPRGEFTLVVEGAPATEKVSLQEILASKGAFIRQEMEELVAEGMKISEVVRLLADKYVLPRRELYRWAHEEIADKK